MMGEIDDYFQRGAPISAMTRAGVAVRTDRFAATTAGPGATRRTVYRALMKLTSGMRADEATVVYVTMLTQAYELLAEKGGPDCGT